MRILLLAGRPRELAGPSSGGPEEYGLPMCGRPRRLRLGTGAVHRWVREQSQHAVPSGNHDHGVAQNVVVQGRSGFKYLTGMTRP